jgi:transcription elongation factor/antiterminator RfaH
MHGIEISSPEVTDVALGGSFSTSNILDAGVETASGGERWYVVYTQPHREFRAQIQLAEQGFRVFLPRYCKTVRHARRLMSVASPFFPRYLFVALDLGRDHWRSVNGTFGVTSLVMADKFPRPVPHGIVESLIEVSNPQGHVELGENLKVGERVRLLSGPFANLVGELARADSAGRVRVLVQLLGGMVTVSIKRSELMSACAA